MARIIEPSFEIEGNLSFADGLRMCRNIERAARTCYKSEDSITDESFRPLIRHIIESGHESVLEHEKITVRFVCDRGVSLELVRHRIASFSQESTRYCNYSKDKFGNELTFIRPCFWEETLVGGIGPYNVWNHHMEDAERDYFTLLKLGALPQEARSILPNSLKTEIVVTANLREWRHILRLRTSEKAHPQMRQLMVPLLEMLKKRIPVIFDDIGV